MKRPARLEEPEQAEPRPLGWFNALTPGRAEAELLFCCGSRAWARRVASGRPYAGRDHVMDEGERIWSELGPADWREAMAAHPRIGGGPTPRAPTPGPPGETEAARAAPGEPAGGGPPPPRGEAPLAPARLL